jgi:hypothetical protein
MLTFSFEKGKQNTRLSVDKLFQGSPFLSPFIDLLSMFSPSKEREEKYRTTLHVLERGPLETLCYNS